MSDKEQEPVAVVSGYYGGHCVILPLNPARIFNANTALYTASPKKEWVGLTDEEARELCVANVPYVVDMVRALEAKLKEKNDAA